MKFTKPTENVGVMLKDKKGKLATEMKEAQRSGHRLFIVGRKNRKQRP